jgi:hypothetical protein
MKFKIVTTIVVVFFANCSFAQLKIDEGSGQFNILGGIGHEQDTIQVFYHKPKSFNSNSKILLVIPGAGRNADDYRDSWIEASEKHSVLIVSPSYAEKQYNFGDYHLAGVVKVLDLQTGISFEKGSNRVHMDESVDRFRINSNSEQWLFHDFDRLFVMVVKKVGSTQKGYDIFGHSAGGQILHRFALLFPNSKANRVLASNAGSYTLPDFNAAFPFGLKDVNLKKSLLKKSFKKNLVVFLGEEDNEHETGGLILRSPTMDKQGTHRFSRGNYFYNKSKAKAKELNANFNWKLHVVSGVGHNQKEMVKAAALYLYDK